MLVGLPGAGKTSLYRERFASTHLRIEDKRLVDAALAGGGSIVVDNTNPRKTDRGPMIAAARRHGARVIGYFFDVTTRAAVARNAVRTGKDRVPNVAIFTVAKRLEAPDRSEGFDELYRVTINEDRSYQLTAVS